MKHDVVGNFLGIRAVESYGWLTWRSRLAYLSWSPAPTRRADTGLATLLHRDRVLRGLCDRIGERHLAVPIDEEHRFRAALRRLCYTLPAKHPHHPTPGRPAAGPPPAGS